MNNKEFWTEMEKLTSTRVNELLEDVSRKNIPGIRLRWTQGLIEINQKWLETARKEIARCKQAESRQAYRAALKVTTFRGNDDN